MTPQERCKNILTILNLPGDFDPKNGISKSSYDAVLMEIEEAQREALDKTYSQGFKDAYAEGFRAAKEKAKGILEDEAFKADCSTDEHADDFMFAANKQGAKRLRLIAQRIGEMEP